MSVFRLIFNILWFVLGGFVMGLLWWLAGILCFVSIIGIPFGRSLSSVKWHFGPLAKMPSTDGMSIVSTTSAREPLAHWETLSGFYW